VKEIIKFIKNIFESLTVELNMTFFQGRAKFSRGGKNILFALKTYYFPLKKSKNILCILAGQGGSRAPSCPPLRTPMELNKYLEQEERGL